MNRYVLIALLLLVIAGASQAQSPQPYAGLESRAIKALSPEQVDDLRAGRGMGLALAAELNGYPGPMHLIELADQLALTPPQRSEIGRLFSQMHAEAMTLGAQRIEAETDLDRLFVQRTVTPETLKAAHAAIARI